FGKNDRGEAERHAKRLELDGDVPLLVTAGGHREFAAGEEGGRLAGDGGQRRLGQRLDHAGLLESPDGHHQVVVFILKPAAGDGVAGQRLVGDCERVAGSDVGGQPAEVEFAGELDAELLGDIALDLCNG